MAQSRLVQASEPSARVGEKIMRCFNSLERDRTQKPASTFADRGRSGGSTLVFTFAAAPSSQLLNRNHARTMISRGRFESEIRMRSC
jgi:hypothetical protein